MLRPSPLTEHCADPLMRADHVCLGVSPFNSHFTVDRIADLARWAMSNFQGFHFFVPDGPSAFTLEALGYNPVRAAQKALRQGNYTRNKIIRALEQVYPGDSRELILDSTVLDTNRAYLGLLSEAHHRFATDPEFAEQCLGATGWVLDKRLPEGEHPTRDQLRSAVRYFLAELPMFVGTVAVAGVGSSVFAYHQRVSFLERLYRRELSWRPSPGQGFVVLENTVSGQAIPEQAVPERVE
ncbi:tRNA-dependent cyclodipeptide synthase [Amycolatopsis sp. WAC 01375]|uniref:tRNA-dependent cyclodipeptide synthase n=1 Tax=unclassified Amycolatopsis TaxID=2618356 RepID=UPI000F7B0097|nr:MULTISPECIES: tRNA-dependent cyclodipeptide synthase [unclassified Amycolatopsis]RSM69337.1 tRNA-dependent cyclodipeptide synthase [Amycolatopsis sp. WAC 01375]RSN30604.1 tRNA-dependent cyclodipeptide synthase [Amycolatopsis sp. WAC 01416]